MRIISVFLIWFMAFLGPVQADEFCSSAIFEDVGDKLSFGRVLIGARRDALPADVQRLPDCYEDPSQNYYDCEYEDRDGVRYLVFEDFVARKELRDFSRYHGRLPANIVAGDSLEIVRRKLSSLPKKFPEWTEWPASADDGPHMSTEICIRASNKTTWSLLLFFDKSDRLIGIQATVGPVI